MYGHRIFAKNICFCLAVDLIPDPLSGIFFWILHKDANNFSFINVFYAYLIYLIFSVLWGFFINIS